MIGIDEVGRGCWAGPLLVVAARARIELPEGLKDSKLLTKAQRRSLKLEIEHACDLGEGWVSAEEIDAHGLSEAMRLGVARALKALHVAPNEAIIMDGNSNYCPDMFRKVECVIKADMMHPIVSAASIYAKVCRDDYMANLDTHYAQYGFEKHVGYGTKLHLELLKLHGVSDLHRRSFAPIKALL